MSKRTPDIIGGLLSDKAPAAAQSTQTADNSEIAVPTEGHTRPIGVGLSEGEIEALQRIAEQTGLSRHAVLKFAVYDFLKDYLNGGDTVRALAASIETPEVKKPTKRLRLP